MKDNFLANTRQRQELKEARASLVEFEVTKARLAEAEAIIRDNAAVGLFILVFFLYFN